MSVIDAVSLMPVSLMSGINASVIDAVSLMPVSLMQCH